MNRLPGPGVATQGWAGLPLPVTGPKVPPAGTWRIAPWQCS